MFKPPYAEDRTYGGVRERREAIASHSLLDSSDQFIISKRNKRWNTIDLLTIIFIAIAI